MRVRIGKYTNWVGPYQVAKWFTPIFGEERIEKFTDGDFFDKWSEKSMPFFNWIESKKHRKISIKIDDYDTWSMDHTLGLIILPMLIQLKDKKQGSPHVEESDLPEYLHKNLILVEDDEIIHKQWDYVFDEMIWAFTALNDEYGEEQFYSGTSDLQSKEIPGSDLVEIVTGPKDTFKVDKVGLAAYHARIANGTTLFGKYYRGLWD